VFSHPVGSAGHIVDSDTIYFFAQVGPVRFPLKVCHIRYVELVFLHPAGTVGHIVHSYVSGVQNVNAPFFMLE
jgi:hypothetical protein